MHAADIPLSEDNTELLDDFVNAMPLRCDQHNKARSSAEAKRKPADRRLTHRDQATNNLFAIAKRFHDNCPPAVKPPIKASNAKELDFLRLDSGYRVGTAKAEGVGRADTIQRIACVDADQALELSIMFVKMLLDYAGVVLVEEDPSEPSR